MWFWGHLAVAYLLYSAVVRRQHRRPSAGGPVLALAVGSQLPDLIDKPLSWGLGVVPGSRALAHSALFLPILIPVALGITARYDCSEVGVAFSVGHVVHLLSDLPPQFFAGEFTAAAYLVWPLFDQPEPRQVGSILDGVLGYSVGPYEWFQLGLFCLAAFVWYRDGCPGIGSLSRRRLKERGQ
ncbi:metal-dependent hydrolase [Halovenus sp. WSH3]|uniref:Metal-dependent hydrolase n=1 Tax=Halovenus carboxidivorans TaxID=2692199 RepID=A0A6B0TBI7_9EURY|nr:metal-dependent hydrolase [Halovenus carboxidivorans]MXR52591.1 metal-dependent hydrolase [Halovenus carboxidivorans]